MRNHFQTSGPTIRSTLQFTWKVNQINNWDLKDLHGIAAWHSKAHIHFSVNFLGLFLRDFEKKMHMKSQGGK